MSDTGLSTTINIPQMIILTLVGVLVFRWFLSSSNNATRPASVTASSSQSRQAVRITPAQVELVTGMFPQLSRRDILWDLQRNGGNVQATTERVLSGRGLEVVSLTTESMTSVNTRQPPQTFQPPMLNPASTPAVRRPVVEAKKGPDLIQRYKLDTKLEEPAEQASEETKAAWSSSKSDRQTMLQKRREEMILAARRKMMEKSKDK